MLKHNKNKENKRIAFSYTAFVLLAIFFVVLFFMPILVYAQVETPDTGSGLDEPIIGLEDVKDEVGLPDTDIRIFAARVINVILGFLGIILVIIIMYGGWVWMTSEGNPEKVNKAKRILKNAGIGLLIILSAFAIVNFIFRVLLGDWSGLGGPRRPPEGYEIGVSALGNGIIESHYPERNQQNVAINTMIFITFKEEIDPDTICGGTAEGCTNEPLISDNIKIYPDQINDDEHEDDTTSVNKRYGNDEVSVSTTDNKTYVFDPQRNLGETDNQLRWFAVKIIEDNLRKITGDTVDLGIEGYYKWRFETNGELDLTPPIVQSIFPPPDNEPDERGVSVAAMAAEGSIEVKGEPKVAKIGTGNVASDSNYKNITITGEYQNCQGEGDANFTIAQSEDVGGRALVLGEVDQSIKAFNGASLIISGQASIGCGLTIVFDGGTIPSDGAIIKINVKQAVAADTLTVGNITYTFGNGTDGTIEVDGTGKTAANIVNKIQATHQLVSASAINNEVTITAKIAGAAGNSITLFSNSTVLTITPMEDGSDMTEDIKINPPEDQPRNAIIQINFNEAVNPLQVNGEADVVGDYIMVQNVEPEATTMNNGVACAEDSDCLSYKCESGRCTGDFINGQFMISNIYKTVEFRSKTKCGENSCGDDIYCLPALSNLKVHLTAASLKAPGESPQANPDGIMDAAVNSLDGDKNGTAEGPVNAFNENDLLDADGKKDLLKLPNLQASYGDNYTWSFWISNKIDLDSPIIESAMQANLNLVKVENGEGKQVLGADQNARLEIQFDKLMMSSTLKPGRNYPDDFYNTEPSNTVQREYLVFIKYTGVPLGYWCGKEDVEDDNPDGYPDKTKAIISHTLLGENSAYGFVVGSGVKDIYQNCYNPAGDKDNCNSGMNAGDSCCKGVRETGTNKCYQF